MTTYSRLLRQMGNRFLYSGISFVQLQKLNDDDDDDARDGEDEEDGVVVAPPPPTPATVRMKRDRTERTTRAWANKRLNYESICTHLAINSSRSPVSSTFAFEGRGGEARKKQRRASSQARAYPKYSDSVKTLVSPAESGAAAG